MIEITPKLSLKYDDYRAVIQHFLDDAADRLGGGESVKLKGIGVLRVRLTGARTFRHPKTGQAIRKSGGRALGFKPSKRWRAYDET